MISVGFRTSHCSPISFYLDRQLLLSYAAIYFGPNFLSMLSKTWKIFSPKVALLYQLLVASAPKTGPSYPGASDTCLLAQHTSKHVCNTFSSNLDPSFSRSPM